jgi:dipeptidyl aminopeptidase/acylaminoacyl peptidase
VVSPDGSQVAFAQTKQQVQGNPKDPLSFFLDFYESTSTWIVPTTGGKAQRLTPWRNHLKITPSSFSPDGGLLALGRNLGKGAGPEAVVLDLASGAVNLIAPEAEEPNFSPDGSQVAFISYRDHISSELNDSGDGPPIVGELYVANIDGSHLRRLTHSKDWQESAPDWDPSGSRLAYSRTTAPEALELGLTNVVMEINADGTCPTLVAGRPAKKDSFGPGFYGPTWQPGSDRGAGPIQCGA